MRVASCMRAPSLALLLSLLSAVTAEAQGSPGELCIGPHGLVSCQADAAPRNGVPPSPGTSCDPNGVCSSTIDWRRTSISVQQTDVWCWAAAAQTIFRFYGYDVSQADIVAT